MQNDWLIPILKEKKCRSFIDIGCGNGAIAGIVKEMLPHIDVFGVDIAKNFIEQASKSFPDVRFKVADIRNKLKGIYDMAFTQGTLIHIPHEAVDKTISNIMEVAKSALFVESRGKEVPGTLIYNPKKYWNKRVGQGAPSQIDHNTQYYFCHDYKRIFRKLRIGFKVLKRWDDKQRTRLYLCQR